MDKLTSVQLSEWEAYNVLDPIGSWRADFNMAKIASIMSNLVAAIYREKDSEPEWSTPKDYMPIWDPEEAKANEASKIKRQSIEEMREVLLNFAAEHNAKIDAAERSQRSTPPTLSINK